MRRRLSLALLTFAFVLALWPQTHAPAVASLRVSGKTVASTVAHSMPAFTVGELRLDTGEMIAAADAGSTGGATLSVTSPVIDGGQLFERVGIQYRAAWGTEHDMLFEIRTSADGASWTEWTLHYAHEDLADRTTNTMYIHPQVAPKDSRYAQYRVWLTAGDPAALLDVELTFLDVTDLNAGPLARLQGDIGGALKDMARSYFGEGGAGLASAALVGPQKIYTRQEWGADEGLADWDPKYVPWKKAVIHHTVTSEGGSDVAAEIRAIYYFHAVTRGWGDIGYHYLVDRSGTIWQGRYGGDNVVGGHAFGWNDGSFAVSAIGDYSIRTPSAAMQQAMASIIATKFTQYGIAPFGADPYMHKEQRPDGSWEEVVQSSPNVLAHRDCTFQVGIPGAQTACPGGRLYTAIQNIKTLAQSAMDQGYQYLSKIDPLLVDRGFPGQQQQVPVLVANKGTVTMPADTTVSYRILLHGQVVSGGPQVPLGKSVVPGASVTVSVPFTAPPQGEYVIRWGLTTGGTWWNTIYNDHVRDQWFRSKDWSARWSDTRVAPIWVAGSAKPVTVTVRNDGGRVWPASGTNPVKVGYYWTSTATGNRFEGLPRLSLPHDVAPGQQITMTIPVNAPVYPTNYTLTFDLRKENEFWFRDKGLRPSDDQIAVGVDWKAKLTLPLQMPTVEAGKSVKVPVTITNTGLGVFPVTNSYPVNLGYHWYKAGALLLWDSPRTKLPADLPPGQSVTVEAEVSSPPEGGEHTLRFDLVQEGVSWFSAQGAVPTDAHLAVAGPVVPVYKAAYEPGFSVLARSGALTAVPFTVRNTSSFTWKAGGADPVTLSYHWFDAQGRIAVWDGLRTPLTRDLAPGESVQLNASVAVPALQGMYTLKWDLVHETVSWFSGKGVRTFDQSVVVGPPPTYGGSVEVTALPEVLPMGAQSLIPVRVTNSSDFDWDPFINLSYHWYDEAGNLLSWDGVRTPLAGIKAGETRALDAYVVAPSTPGTYVLRFDPVHEMVTWFSGRGVALAPVTVRVDVAQYAAQYGTPGSAEGAVNETVTVPVLVSNQGALTWQPGTVNLAYHLYAESGNVYVWDGARTALPRPLASGESAVLQAQVRLPERTGTFTVRFDLVHEGVSWFSGRGVAPAPLTLTVR